MQIWCRSKCKYIDRHNGISMYLMRAFFRVMLFTDNDPDTGQWHASTNACTRNIGIKIQNCYHSKIGKHDSLPKRRKSSLDILSYYFSAVWVFSLAFCLLGIRLSMLLLLLRKGALIALRMLLVARLIVVFSRIKDTVRFSCVWGFFLLNYTYSIESLRFIRFKLTFVNKNKPNCLLFDRIKCCPNWYHTPRC